MAMLSPRLASRAQIGLEAPLVHVEVHLASGLPKFSIVGMAATAVKESKDRVRAALLNSKFELPAGRITVNLAPADVPKEGGRFDLPIALGILLASGQLTLRAEECDAALARFEFYGELALSGELKSVRGVLLAAAHARRAGHELIVPRENFEEARIAARGNVCGAAHLLEVSGHLSGMSRLANHDAAAPLVASIANGPAPLDLCDVHGQLQAKRAVTVAAAGAHSLLMLGPPGSGKSMLAQRLPGLLPPLTEQEALEVATIASVSTSGFDPRAFGRRPLRAPHHSASFHSIVGGGRYVSPGEVSLAHHGVLFLDELPEFDRRALEALREPLEAGVIQISRVSMRAEYPAVFQLVAAMNPCPCGYLGDQSGRCSCSATRIAQYRGRISGPLLDRIDLRIEVPAVPQSALIDSVQTGEPSAMAAVRVQAARGRQLARSKKLNSQLSVQEINEHCRPNASGRRLLWQSREKLGMSVRSYHRTLRVARTIADLEGGDTLGVAHVAEALQLKRAVVE
jgi:magnesium chelatase family protein